MSDVKRFTGFIAADGSTHNTQAQAIAHSREVKTKKALADFFGDNRVVTEGGSELLAEFLYVNRETVLAALNQEVLLRKPRAKKVKPPVNAGSAPATV